MGNYPSLYVILGKATNSNWTSHRKGRSFGNFPNSTLQPGGSIVIYAHPVQPQDFKWWAGAERIQEQLGCRLVQCSLWVIKSSAVMAATYQENDSWGERCCRLYSQASHELPSCCQEIPKCSYKIKRLSFHDRSSSCPGTIKLVWNPGICCS